MKKALSILTAIMLLETFTAQAFTVTTDNGIPLRYFVNSNNVSVTLTGHGTPCTGTLVIPNSITYNGTTYTVSSIGNSAFYFCDGLTSVNIPNSVTSIGDYAFCGCNNLTFVNIPSSVSSIGNFAFSGCSELTSITIPNSVTHIGDGAFSNCSSLSLIIPNSVTSIDNNAFYMVRHIEYHGTASGSPWGALSINGIIDGDFVFSNAAKDTLIAYIGTSNTVNIPNSVTSIGNYAFNKCTNLTSVNIPDSVTSIGNYAFYGCSGMISITIPNSVTSIGNDAFSDCSGMISITIPNSVTSIGNDAFFNCTGLTSVNIPNAVTSIGYSAFYRVRHIDYHGTATGSPWGARSMNGITDGDFVFSNIAKDTLIAYIGTSAAVTIPNSVISIGDNAFREYNNLTSVNIPNSVTHIGYQAFSQCYGLTSVNIPNAVTTIGSAAFYGVRHIEYHGTATGSPWGALSINGIIDGDFVFSNAAKDTLIAYIGTSNTVNIPNSVTYIGNYAFNQCTNLTSVNIPESVTSIGNYAFANCTGLDSLYIGNSVTSISNNAFSACLGLTTVMFNADSCTSTGNSANTSIFSGCRNITSFTFGNNVKVIPSYLCANLSNLNYVYIGNSVTHIGDGVFYYCDRLSSVVFNADSCISVGTNFHIFAGCTNINSFTFGNNVRVIPSKLCCGLSELTSIIIPNSVTTIGDYAFDGCDGLTSVNIPNSVTSIGNYAFSCGYALTSVNIGNSVTSIGNYAFSFCQALTSVNIGHSVTSIGNYAFFGCEGLTSLTFPNSVISIGSGAFNDCIGLVHVTIGNGIISIGDSAFIYCSQILDFHMRSATPPSIQPHTFQHVPSSTHIYVPCGATTVYQNASAIWSQFNLEEEFVYSFSATSTNPMYGTVQLLHVPECDNLQAEVQANANNGFHFVRWSDGNTDAHRYLVVDQDTSIQAEFAEDEDTFTITVSSDDPTMGTATVDGSSSATLTSGETVTLIANANEGYRFVRWNDNNTDNPRTVTVTSDMDFTAFFEAETGIGDVTSVNIKIYAYNGCIYVNLDGQPFNEFSIYDMTGRCVVRMTNSDKSPALPNGIYLVKVGNIAKKVAIVK